MAGRITVLETYYLIDFENIKIAGGKLSYTGIPKNSNVIVFLTSRDILAESEKPKRVDIHFQIFDNIPEGREFVDKYISAYMGYLAGVYDKENLKVYIVSRNKGYDNIIAFMSDLVNAERREQVAEKAQKKAAPAAMQKAKRTDEGKASKCLLEIEEALYEYGADIPRKNFDVVLNIVKESLNGKDKKSVLAGIKEKLYVKFPYIGEFYMEVVTPPVEDYFK